MTIKRQNVARTQFIGHMDQAGVGKVGGRIVVLANDGLNQARYLGELKWDLKEAGGDILNHRFWRARNVVEQVTTFRNHSLTGHQWLAQTLNRIDAVMVPAFTAVQQGNNHPRIEKNRLHLRPPFAWSVDPRRFRSLNRILPCSSLSQPRRASR